MSKINADPRLPIVKDENVRPLTQRLYELFRQYAIAHNKSYMWDTEGTAPPTTGTWAISQMCKNTNPTGSGSLIVGWVCSASGTPGTWMAITASIGRELVSSNRTYYVRTDGSNSNNGLSNTSGGAFLTIQKAVDVVTSTLDIAAGVTITIQVADGTYSGTTSNTLKPYIGAGSVSIVGNTTTPSNCIISITGASCFVGYSPNVIYSISGFKLTTATSGGAIVSFDNSTITLSNIDFGSCVEQHMSTTTGGSIIVSSNYTISGGATSHCYAISSGYILTSNKTVTITGTPNFSNAYVWMDRGLGMVDCFGMTFNGSATGKRYIVNNNSVCFVNGAATTYLPGNVAGTTANGGVYA